MRASGRTKIVATLGPASESPEVLDRMVEAGLDVVRLNFSHGTAADHERRLTAARQAAGARKAPLAVLQDLPGPKLRIGTLPGERIVLTAGQRVVLTPEPTRADGVIPVAYPHLADDVGAGQRIFLQDGELALVVRRVDAPRVSTCRACA
jgi:pyruvate kinase